MDVWDILSDILDILLLDEEIIFKIILFLMIFSSIEGEQARLPCDIHSRNIFKKYKIFLPPPHKKLKFEFKKLVQFLLYSHCKLEVTKEESKIYATSLVQLCYIVVPLVITHMFEENTFIC